MVTFEELSGFFHSETVEALSAKILNRVNAFICLIDVQNFKLVWINRYFINKLGYSADALMNMTSDEILEHVDPDFRERLVQTIQSIDNGNNGNRVFLIKIRTRANNWIWILSAFHAYEKNDAGQLVRMLSLGTIVDIDQLYCQLSGIISNDKASVKSELTGLLTSREKVVVKLIAGGNSDKRISEILGISFHTAKTHRKRIIRKLGLKNSSALIRYAVENGLC